MIPFLKLSKVIEVSEFDGLMQETSSVSSEDQETRSMEQWVSSVQYLGSVLLKQEPYSSRDAFVRI